MIYRIFYCACLVLFMGCNDFSTFENIELPTHKPKLVVFANLRTRGQGYNHVYVAKTRNALDTASGKAIGLDSFRLDSTTMAIYDVTGLDTVNATVELYRNDVLFDVPKRENRRFNSVFNDYYLNEPLDADGATYKLRVSAAGFETVEAVQIMPPLVKLDSVQLRRKGFVYKDFTLYPNAYEFLYYFKDSVAKTPHYYAAFSNIFFGYKPLLNLDPTLSGNVLSDVGFNGKPFAWQVFYDDYANYQPQSASFNLNSTTRDAFLFEQSSNRYFATKDNRFAEPTTLYSNIKNGYGLFTLSAVSEFYLKF